MMKILKNDFLSHNSICWTYKAVVKFHSNELYFFNMCVLRFMQYLNWASHDTHIKISFNIYRDMKICLFTLTPVRIYFLEPCQIPTINLHSPVDSHNCWTACWMPNNFYVFLFCFRQWFFSQQAVFCFISSNEMKFCGYLNSI